MPHKFHLVGWGGSRSSAPAVPPVPPMPSSDPSWTRPNGRLLCPVSGCPCSQQDHPGWSNMETIKVHINSHLSGQLEGSIPDAWLSAHGKCSCRHCGLLCAASRGVHPSCRASERRSAAPTARSTGTDDPGHPVAPQAAALPSLDDVFRKRVPTVKHVPQKARSLWARCLIST